MCWGRQSTAQVAIIVACVPLDRGEKCKQLTHLRRWWLYCYCCRCRAVCHSLALSVLPQTHVSQNVWPHLTRFGAQSQVLLNLFECPATFMPAIAAAAPWLVATRQPDSQSESVAFTHLQNGIAHGSTCALPHTACQPACLKTCCLPDTTRRYSTSALSRQHGAGLLELACHSCRSVNAPRVCLLYPQHPK